MYRVEAHASGINARHDEVCADVALVAEQVLLQHRHDGRDARRAAGAETMELQVGGCDGRGELGVGGGAGASAPDLGGDVVQFLAVLVGHDGARGGAGVGGDDDAGGVDAADDGGAGAGGAGQGDAAGMEGEVAGVVAEIEARHGESRVKAGALRGMRLASG